MQSDWWMFFPHSLSVLLNHKGTIRKIYPDCGKHFQHNKSLTRHKCLEHGADIQGHISCCICMYNLCHYSGWKRTSLIILRGVKWKWQQVKVTVEPLYTNTTTQAFATYFIQYYVEHKREWTVCYRKNPELNTNMYVEAFHSFQTCILTWKT